LAIYMLLYPEETSIYLNTAQDTMFDALEITKDFGKDIYSQTANFVSAIPGNIHNFIAKNSIGFGPQCNDNLGVCYAQEGGLLNGIDKIATKAVETVAQSTCVKASILGNFWNKISTPKTIGQTWNPCEQLFN
ncbi:MAG: hypothetical protein ABIF12_02405, partial [bacterium]